MPVTDAAIEIRQRLGDGEHQRQCLLGDREGVGADRDHHRDPVLAGAGDVDRLHAHAMLDDDLHAAGLFVHRSADAPARPDNDGIRPLFRRLRRDLLCGAIGLHHHDPGVAPRGNSNGAVGQGRAGDEDGSGHGDASAAEGRSGHARMRPLGRVCPAGTADFATSPCRPLPGHAASGRAACRLAGRLVCRRSYPK